MPFQPTTLDRVMGVLELPVTIYYVQHVQNALNHVEAWGAEGAIERIESYLAEFDRQKALRRAASKDAGLIRADVLEWQLNGKTKGISAEMSSIKRELARALLLEAIVPRSGVRLIR